MDRSSIRMSAGTIQSSDAAVPTGATSGTPIALVADVPIAQQQEFCDLAALAGSGHSGEDYRNLGSASGVSPPWPGNRSERNVRLSAIEPEEANPLAKLADEYRLALLHQKTGEAHQLKTSVTDGSGATLPQDPFARTFADPAEDSLLKFLVSGNNIDTVLERMDAFGAERIFEPEEPHEILSLLTPEHALFRHVPRTANLAREEHHMISVDSHIQMLASTEHGKTCPS